MLLATIDQGYDVAIGSRVVRREGELEVKTTIHRRIIGRTFAFFSSLLALSSLRLLWDICRIFSPHRNFEAGRSGGVDWCDAGEPDVRAIQGDQSVSKRSRQR